MADNNEKKLNKAQQEAVNHDSGPALIVAGAGTGKTTVLIERLKRLVLGEDYNARGNEKREGPKASLDEVLLLTFTEKGAGEMEDRALKALPMGSFDPWISTFHGFCERLLRRHALDIGLSPDFRLLDQTGQWILIKKNLDRFNLDYYRPLGNPNKFIIELITHFSRLKDENISPLEYLEYAEGLEADIDAMLGGGNKKSKNKNQNNKPKTKNSPVVLDEVRPGIIRVENPLNPGIAQSKRSSAAVQNENAAEIARLKELANAYHVYNHLLVEEAKMDFGDLINYTIKLFRERPNILACYQNKFKYIMVDEFQDTNWAQYELVKMLAKPAMAASASPAERTSNLMVVGDDDQSIYRFRGTSLFNIMQFKDDYPEAKEVVLTKNYRSGQNILDLAHSFIQHNNPNRLEERLKIDKKLESRAGFPGKIETRQFADGPSEVVFTVEEIIKLKKDNDIEYSDIAILVRSNASADPYISELRSKNIPNVFVSLKGLYCKPLIMDLIAYLKLLDNYHESSALFRVLNMAEFKVDYADIVNINRMAGRKHWSLFEALKNIRAISGVGGQAAAGVEKLLSYIERHSQWAKEKSCSELFVSIINDIKLHKGWDHYEDKEKFSLLNQFYRKIKKFEEAEPEAKLKDFMEYMELERESGETGSLAQEADDSEKVKIMTVHAAKGLEFRHVFVVGLADKKFPTIARGEKIPVPDALVKDAGGEEGNTPPGPKAGSSAKSASRTAAGKGGEKERHLEEERRLFYVAMTRAKERLYLLCAKDYGGAREKKPSLFLEEAGLAPDLRAVQDAKQDLWQAVGRQEEPAGESADTARYFLPKRFSFSQIEAYNNCPLQYKFNFVLKIPVPQKAQLVFGRVIHNTLKEFLSPFEAGSAGQMDLFGREAPKDKPGPKEIKKIYESYWQDEGYADRKERDQYHKLGREMVANFCAVLEENGWPEILYLEKSFQMKLGGHSFKGAIDRIDRLPGGGLEIIDYKTGNTPKNFHYQQKKQLLLYKLALEQILEMPVDQLTFYYLKDNVKKSFRAAGKDLEKVEAEAIGAINDIISQKFPPQPGMLCRYCDFRDICEFRAA